MTRIRYIEENGILKSKPLLVSNGDVYTIELHPSELRYVIKTSTGHLVSSGEGTTLSDLKKLAKSSIRAYGAIFLDEIRKNK